ncbi:MAG TPA: hypothetical protein VMT73_09880 [Anaerolineales bacterium]|nr:hypothetical protein [Anaerolineales bacterium]
MKADNPIRNFDPHKIAHYEKENYVAYYQKDWLKLLCVSVGLVKESFALSLWQAIYGAYLIARAEIAFAPFPDNDIPKTESYVKRFYRFIKNVHGEDFDVEHAAKLEVNWWSVHRKLFGNPENQELVEALANLYAEAYGIPVEKVQDAARLRALGMLYSDQWVNAGKPENSPLLTQEEETLLQSYVALKEAIR